MPIVTFKNKEFPSEATLPGGLTIDAVNFSQLTGEASSIDRHAFIFWHLADSSTTRIEKNNTFVQSLQTTPFAATAWYIATGPGRECKSITVYGFSERLNAVLKPDSPIESVSPGAAWSGGSSNVVSVESSNVQITVKASIDSDIFDTWLIFGDASVSGRTITVEKQKCPLVIALYKHSTFPHGPSVGDVFGALDNIMGKLKWRFDPAPWDLGRLRELIEEAVVRERPAETKKKAIQKKTRKK
jgi:hypothetical protein